ncbi:hypothetical protein BJX62DRAFT_195286 [Aspergillus germanicus]
MHPELSAPSPQRTPFKGAASPLRPVRFGRWYVPTPLFSILLTHCIASLTDNDSSRSVPLLATIAIGTSLLSDRIIRKTNRSGYGVTSYISKTQDSSSQLAEAERLRKNQQLMDAYGYKDNVDDLQKALEAYEVQ